MMPSMTFNLPFSFARKNQLVLEHQEGLSVLFTEQTPLAALQDVQAQLWILHPQQSIEWRKVSAEQLSQKVQVAYADSGSNSIDVADSIQTDDLATVFAELGEPEDLLDSADDAPIIKLLNAVLTEAIRAEASDIHIEPYENQLRVRFRVDGVLKTVLSPKPGLASMLVSRIKVMARLDIAEKRIPQDGRMALKLGGRAVDLRVSTLPSSFGERVVLRLLDKGAERLTLKDLGMPARMEADVAKALSKAHGIFLVTGPTGSGKTTTLYAGLMGLNDTQRNIMTIEDPVEYNIDGINQTQVNTKADLTFARGLRALLRQDPDVVMIGEIRDPETAQIAVQASLTGHLVLSTLHTNTAVGALTRLRDMGTEAFLLASSLNGVLAQRLVRKLCVHCKQPHTADSAECAQLGVASATVYQANGCDICQHTGYAGRMGLYELLLVDDKVRSMIHSQQSEAEIDAYLRQSAPSLNQSGFQAVLDGKTSLDEVLRVTQN
ncbi:type II secretion system ATPase GspE [Thiosulfatimonas sediminis]|nr:type II secretion system ATPase GspE [Thiosulfatimonas sediminis]